MTKDFKMDVLGLDCSPTSTGLVKFSLDENLEITKISKLGFYEYDIPKKKNFEPPQFQDIISYPSTFDFYNRSMMMMEHITPFISGCEYAAIEGLAYNAKGDLISIAEFTSQIKFTLLKQGSNIRMISPYQNKQFATGFAKDINKPEMFDAFIKEPIFNSLDIFLLPEIPTHKKGKNAGKRDTKGISPTSDIVDAAWLGYTLVTELRVRNNIIPIDNLPPNQAHVLSHTTKKNSLPLFKREFIHKWR